MLSGKCNAGSKKSDSEALRDLVKSSCLLRLCFASSDAAYPLQAKNNIPPHPHKQKVILQIDISSPRVTMKENIESKGLIVTVKCRTITGI